MLCFLAKSYMSLYSKYIAAAYKLLEALLGGFFTFGKNISQNDKIFV